MPSAASRCQPSRSPTRIAPAIAVRPGIRVEIAPVLSALVVRRAKNMHQKKATRETLIAA